MNKWTELGSIAEAMSLGSDIGVMTADGRVSAKQVYDAFSLLWAQPASSNPYEIAQYYEEITATNDKGEKYNEEWSTDFNPLIVCFFTLTQITDPEGDDTAWCAAFMNFCLNSAGKQTTGSAASASFRTYGTETATPSVGDLVVFQNIKESETWKGHVGFYVSETTTHIHILGGNQSNRIDFSNYPKESDKQRFHSYRRMD